MTVFNKTKKNILENFCRCRSRAKIYLIFNLFDAVNRRNGANFAKITPGRLKIWFLKWDFEHFIKSGSFRLFPCYVYFNIILFIFALTFSCIFHPRILCTFWHRKSEKSASVKTTGSCPTFLKFSSKPKTSKKIRFRRSGWASKDPRFESRHHQNNFLTLLGLSVAIRF